jgi:hypothetical protein
MKFEIPKDYILCWQVPMFDKESNIEEDKRKKMLFDSGSKLVNEILPRLEGDVTHCIVAKEDENLREVVGICREAKTFGRDDYFIGPELFNVGDLHTVSYRNKQ